MSCKDFLPKTHRPILIWHLPTSPILLLRLCSELFPILWPFTSILELDGALKSFPLHLARWVFLFLIHSSTRWKKIWSSFWLMGLEVWNFWIELVGVLKSNDLLSQKKEKKKVIDWTVIVILGSYVLCKYCCCCCMIVGVETLAIVGSLNCMRYLPSIKVVQIREI